MSASSYRIAIVGAGAIGRAHANAVKQLPHNPRLAVCDPNPSALEAFLQEFPHATAHASLESLLADRLSPTDIVVLAMPPKPRLQVGLQAIAAGYHTLAEKPLAFADGEGEQLIEAAEKAGVLFACCDCRFLGQGSVNSAKELINSGRLGKIYRLTWRARSQRSRSGIEWQPESRWFLKRAISGGGIVMDWAPYDLATIHDLINPDSVTIQHAWMQQAETALPDDLKPTDMDVESHAGARLVYTTKRGTIAVDYERSACLHGPEQQHFFIEGTRGSIEFIWTWDQKLILHTDLNMSSHSESIPIEDDGLHCHDRPLVYFQHAVAGQPHAATLGWQTWFNYAVLRGMYEAADNDESVTIAYPQVTEPKGGAT